MRGFYSRDRWVPILETGSREDGFYVKYRADGKPHIYKYGGCWWCTISYRRTAIRTYGHTMESVYQSSMEQLRKVLEHGK